MQTIYTSLQTNNHTNTSSLINVADKEMKKAEMECWHFDRYKCLSTPYLVHKWTKTRRVKNWWWWWRRNVKCATHIHPFNGPLSGTTRVSWYQKGKTNLDFTEARDSGWQWHQLGHMQVCTSLQIDNHASTPPLSFLQTGCPSCRPTNSVAALKATNVKCDSQQETATYWSTWLDCSFTSHRRIWPSRPPANIATAKQ